MPRSFPDYYAILQVSTTATLDEIRQAYRALVKQHHPDRFRTYAEKNAHGEILKGINEAYDVLSDPVRRHTYDQWRTSTQPPAPSPAPSPPISPSASSARSDWFLWAAVVGSLIMTIASLPAIVSPDPFANPIRTLLKVLVFGPGIALLSFVVVLMGLFVCLFLIAGVRLGMQLGSTPSPREGHSRVCSRLAWRLLTISCVLIALAQTYFAWSHPILVLASLIGIMILGYGFLFVPMLFGECIGMAYYVLFTRRVVAQTHALVLRRP